MIKFFSKIRFRLFNGENKTIQYLKYCIGEILLIVVGILIALQINNANESLKINEIKKKYYVQILNSLKIDKETNKQKIKYYNTQLNVFEEYKQNKVSCELTQKQLFNIIKKISFKSNQISFMTYNSLETLINSGELKIFPENFKKETIAVKNLMDQTINGNINEGIGKHAPLNKLILMIGTDIYNTKFVINNDQKLREIILAYEGIQLWRENDHKNILRRTERFEKHIDLLTKIINKELK
tara:strand:- start:51 stop:773 length:723 start_codon:yes stop_codon:yes gene_type:complete